MNILNLLMLSILCILTMFIICGMFYLYSKGKVFTKFYHNIMGWHIPYNHKTNICGINIQSRCKICKKKIMMDSQGNWF